MSNNIFSTTNNIKFSDDISTISDCKLLMNNNFIILSNKNHNVTITVPNGTSTPTTIYNVGCVYIFTFNSNSISLIETLLPSDITQQSEFGTHFSLNGNNLLISDTNNKLYFYRYNGMRFTPVSYDDSTTTLSLSFQLNASVFEIGPEELNGTERYIPLVYVIGSDVYLQTIKIETSTYILTFPTQSDTLTIPNVAHFGYNNSNQLYILTTSDISFIPYEFNSNVFGFDPQSNSKSISGGTSLKVYNDNAIVLSGSVINHYLIESNTTPISLVESQTITKQNITDIAIYENIIVEGNDDKIILYLSHNMNEQNPSFQEITHNKPIIDGVTITDYGSKVAMNQGVIVVLSDSHLFVHIIKEHFDQYCCGTGNILSGHFCIRDSSKDSENRCDSNYIEVNTTETITNNIPKQFHDLSNSGSGFDSDQYIITETDLLSRNTIKATDVGTLVHKNTLKQLLSLVIYNFINKSSQNHIDNHGSEISTFDIETIKKSFKHGDNNNLFCLEKDSNGDIYYIPYKYENKHFFYTLFLRQHSSVIPINHVTGLSVTLSGSSVNFDNLYIVNKSVKYIRHIDSINNTNFTTNIFTFNPLKGDDDGINEDAYNCNIDAFVYQGNDTNKIELHLDMVNRVLSGEHIDKFKKKKVNNIPLILGLCLGAGVLVLIVFYLLHEHHYNYIFKKDII